MDSWTMIKADREAFADYLDGLSDAEWKTQSLCDDWTVKGVAAHILVAPTNSKGQIFAGFLKAGFNLHKFSAKQVDGTCAANTGPQLAAKVRSTAGSQNAPPGLKAPGLLGDLLIHIGDVTRPLGKPITLPVEHYIAALDAMKTQEPVLHCKSRVAGLTMRATDVDWTHGAGPTVEGPAEALLSAMAGRAEAADELTGDGVDTLKSRC